MDVSIIIVNYNTKELIGKCLKSIYEHTKDIQFEVIVSDNGSTDGSIEMIKTEFTTVNLIENNVNLGFGAANNRGLKIAKGKYVFYLNSDTLLLNNAVKIFFNFWENSPDKEKLGALGANLLDENKEVTHSYGSFPTSISLITQLMKAIIGSYIRFFCSYFTITIVKKKKYLEKIGAVDYISGANIFLLNNELAKFDETFFLYYEETDLEYQLMKKKLKRLLIKGPCIIHYGSGSDKKENYFQLYNSFSFKQACSSRIIYAEKNGKLPFLNTLIKALTYILLMNPFIKKS